MTCYHPIPAWQNVATREVVFAEKRSHGKDLRAFEVACGQCIGCRLARAKHWAMRCMHEASLYESNSFVTLTYDEAHMPVRGNLEYPTYQKFMKRLRKETEQKLRFFMCGEYGDLGDRPHYHALIFNYGFPDKTPLKKLASGNKVFRSEQLERLWPFGMSSIGNVTFQSAAYVARYTLKKITGKGADDAYRRFDEYGEYQKVPEFCHMSLRPGIGRPWLDKFRADVYPHDYVVVDGRKEKPPKYYDKIFDAESPLDSEWMKHQRMLEAMAHPEDNTPERLAVRETVTRAKYSQFRRSEKE